MGSDFDEHSKSVVSDSGQNCPNCGLALTPQTKPAPPTRVQLAKSILWAILLAFLIYNDEDFGCRAIRTSLSATGMDHRTKATLHCREFVRARLPARWTADFPLFRDEVAAIDPSTYIVRSHVYARNGSGSRVRNNYYCMVRLNNGDDADIGNWSLVDLTMNP